MLLGADPELFVLDNDFNVVNSFKYIKNNKNKPLKISKYKFFFDNIALEVNFPPVNNAEAFSNSIKACIIEAKKIVQNSKLSLQAHAFVPMRELVQNNAKEIGCEPDLDAYKFSYNKIPAKYYESTNERCIGGHIHLGGFDDNLVTDPFFKPIFVYMLDLFLAIPSVLIENSSESYKRRKVYGKAGTYKSKSYGLEYRVLSPFWLCNEKSTNFIFKMCEFIFNEMEDGIYKKFWKLDLNKMGPKTKKAYDCFGYNCEEVRQAINNCDTNLCKKYYTFIQNFLPNNLVKEINDLIKTKFDPINFSLNT